MANAATAAVDAKVRTQFQRRQGPKYSGVHAGELLVQRHADAKGDEERAEAVEGECCDEDGSYSFATKRESPRPLRQRLS
jgi:hypothetical protein